MFSKKEIIETTVKNLASAYDSYERANWVYGRADAGVGGFLVDGCITNTRKLEAMLMPIGKGLVENSDYAKKASLLWQKLYNDGFADGMFKEQIQKNFKEILPSEFIEKLDSGAAMADIIEAFYIIESSIGSMPRP
ncbi:MAG: hypothetical protein Q8M03_07920 [Legionella sp.]|nr:hypothetical protein [Legionella sp.]